MKTPLFVLALLCGAAACAMAEETDFNKRKLTVDTKDGKQIVFKSEGRTDDDKSKLYVRISVDSGLEIEVKSELDTAGDASKEVYKFRLERSFSFKNNDISQQTSCQNYDLTKPPVDFTFSCSEAPAGKWTCRAISAWLNVSAYIVEDVVRRNGLPDLLPGGVEFDVQLLKAACSAGDKLALEARFEGDIKADLDTVDDDTNEDGEVESSNQKKLKIGAGDFRWLTVATLNGNVVNVINPNVDLKDKKVTFSFDTTDVGVISWDPFLGLSSSAALRPTILSLFVVAIASVFRFVF